MAEPKEKRWLVADKRGGAYGTVTGPTWFAARQKAELRWRVPLAYLAAREQPVLPGEDGTDDTLFRLLGINYRVFPLDWVLGVTDAPPSPLPSLVWFPECTLKFPEIPLLQKRKPRKKRKRRRKHGR